MNRAKQKDELASPTGKAGKPRNKPLDLKGGTQFERFVETAKALEVDESGKEFERTINMIIPVAARVKKSKAQDSA